MSDKLLFLKILYTKKLEVARDELKNNENLTDLQVMRIRYEIKFILQLLKEINH